MPKGYYTDGCYWGLLDGKYYQFATEQEYREIFDEITERKEQHDA